MRINFILPGIVISGGVRVVFEYANRLAEKGHDVKIIYPLIPLSLGEKPSNFKYFPRKILGFLKNIINGNNPKWFDLKVKIISPIFISERFIPNADITVATLWQTANYVNKYSAKKGKKFYLIQHYENWCGPEKDVDKTYRLNIYKIVVSNWLKNLLKKKFKVNIEKVILNGVNLEHFYPKEHNKDEKKIRILIPYRQEKWKGFEDGIKAFEIIKKECPQVELVSFGPKPLTDKMPEGINFYESPSKEKLSQIYSSCDIFIFPSLHEGSGLPPMEAMACGCAVVATNVGAVPDYCINNKTAMICEPGDYKEMAKNAIKLIKDKNFRNTLAKEGLSYVSKFTWDKSTEELEKCFKSYL